MKRACVLGSPIAHSLSPKLHGYWLQQHNIAGEYTAEPCQEAELAALLGRLADQNYAGCNLTLPLKEKALALMDQLDDSAKITGAVNTVVFMGGKKTGYNSDGFGFMESLKMQRENWNGARVVILGAGGAARAIAAALRSHVKHFTIVNRTPQKAENMICDLRLWKAEALPWEDCEEALEGATLLINCTSLGMAGQPPLDIRLQNLPATATVCDIVYRPLVTPLLQEARMRGNAIVTGLPMLLHQGRLGFRHWFGIDPTVSDALYEEMAACAK
jgi:shikimate dehydrogenase